jgi:hypothetical protein
MGSLAGKGPSYITTYDSAFYQYNLSTVTGIEVLN